MRKSINIYSNKIENKGLSFNINIEHSLPEFLYGDKINFKELLNNVLDYALSETLHGYIELNVNTIIKNDVCRLMISVEDSSTNNNINTITKDNKELYNKLYSNKESIESELGYKVIWDYKENSKASSISIVCDFKVDFNSEDLERGYEWLLQKAEDFKRVFKKYL